MAATNFAAWWTEAQWVWTVCLRLLPDSIAAAFWTQALLCPSPAHKYKQFLNLCLFWVRVVFVCIFTGFVCIFVCFCVSLDHFGFCVLVLLRFVFLVPSQEVGWKERVWNDLFSVEWDVKPCSIYLITAFGSGFTSGQIKAHHMRDNSALKLATMSLQNGRSTGWDIQKIKTHHTIKNKHKEIM